MLTRRTIARIGIFRALRYTFFLEDSPIAIAVAIRKVVIYLAFPFEICSSEYISLHKIIKSFAATVPYVRATWIDSLSSTFSKTTMSPFTL